MSNKEILIQRSGNQCELCFRAENLEVLVVSQKSGDHIEDSVYACEICKAQIGEDSEINPNHWRCLNESMWSEVPAVQVIAWRMLQRHKTEGWPVDLLEMLYLDEQTLAWAKEELANTDASIEHKDSNGVTLSSGDAVVLIKDLKVKGAGFTAKRGTAVRNISLVHDNVDQIEGKVNGQKIVILTQYVKK